MKHLAILAAILATASSLRAAEQATSDRVVNSQDVGVLYFVAASRAGDFEAAGHAILAELLAGTPAQQALATPVRMYRVQAAPGENGALFMSIIKGGTPLQDYTIDGLIAGLNADSAARKKYKDIDQWINALSPMPLLDIDDYRRPMTQPSNGTPVTAPAAPSSADLSADLETKNGQVQIHLAVRVTEKNDVWWRYAYRVTVSNKGTSAYSNALTVEFQDRDGFAIDSDIVNIAIGSSDSTTYTGYKLVRMPGAANVSRVSAR